MARQLALSLACEGLLRYKTATGKSPHTIEDYRSSFKKLLVFIKDDPPIGSIARDQLVAFFAWLQDDYVSDPDGVAPRKRGPLSPKSVLNIHTALSSLWTWATDEGFAPSHIVRTIKPPPAPLPAIEPFAKEEVSVLLKACDNSRSWKTHPDIASYRPTADRDRPIIMTLLDTGIRASELCGVTFGDLNLGDNHLKVRGKGVGRQGRERIVYFGNRTGHAIWKYLAPRLQSIRPDDPVFVVGGGQLCRPLSRGVLGKLLARIGERAGVRDVFPHRFRHTFAINYLRNKGDIFTLQALLGHSDLAMVRRYARIALTDCAEAHRRPSPVGNWRLQRSGRSRGSQLGEARHLALDGD